MTVTRCCTTAGSFRCDADGEHRECETTASAYAEGRRVGVVLEPVERTRALQALERVRLVALRSAGVLESQIVADCELLARAIGGARHMIVLTEQRLRVLADTWSSGSFVGAPATREEERMMARELLALRENLAATQARCTSLLLEMRAHKRRMTP